MNGVTNWSNRLKTFKRMVREGNAKDLNPVLRKEMISTVEMMGDRLVGYTITTDTVDRQNDIVSIDGWELENYKANPVVLWGHNARDLPIGRCVELNRQVNALKAVVEYVPLDMPVVGPLAEAVMRMSRAGFISATSVGFRAIDYEIAEDRDDGESWWAPLNFLRQELLEFSVVTIPANPEALIDPDERLSVDPSRVAQLLAEHEERIAAGNAERLAAAAEAERLAAEASAASVRAHRLARIRAFT